MLHVDTKPLHLIERAASGDEHAFSELVRSCQSTLYAAAMAITKNPEDAEDAVQEAILKGWAKLGNLREPQYFTTWMTRIAIRTAINIRRKHKPSVPLLIELPAKGSKAEERMDVRRAIEELDEKTRLATVLYYFEDMPIEQIAQVVGARQGTVKSRLHRARAKLRDVLEGYEDGE